jgi:hypothetical protein
MACAIFIFWYCSRKNNQKYETDTALLECPESHAVLLIASLVESLIACSGSTGRLTFAACVGWQLKPTYVSLKGLMFN